MDAETRQLLARWWSLERGDGLRRAVLMARVLGIVVLGLCIFTVYAVVYGHHPAFIVIANVLLGWALAERNALRTRLVQWPIFRGYIDWKRIQEDLSGKE